MAKKKNTLLFQTLDYEGCLWDVVEARPTEHGWSVLLGWPVDDYSRSDHKRQTARKVLITPELKCYLEQLRMNRVGIQLPVSSQTISRLRKKLGMNYYNDMKNWWAFTRNELLPDFMPEAVDPNANQIPTPRKALSRTDMRRMLNMIEDGKKTPSIATALDISLLATTRNRWNLGINMAPRYWSKEEEETLGQHVAAGLTIKEIALLMARSAGAVWDKIRLLKLPIGRQNTKWSSEEIATLNKLVKDGLGTKEIAQTLGRSIAAIVFARRLRIGPAFKNSTQRQNWSPEEINTLRKLKAEGLKTKEIAKALGRSSRSTSSAIIKFVGQTTTRGPYKTWTSIDFDTLKKLVEEGLSTKEIAQAMERTVFSIWQTKRQIFGPTRKWSEPRKSWSPEEINTLRKLKAEGLKTKEIAKALGRSLKSTSNAVTKFIDQSQKTKGPYKA